MENLNHELDIDENEVNEVEYDGAIWSPQVEDYFIVLLVEEVNNGNRKATTLTKGAWERIREQMKKRTNREYTQVQFKNKFNNLRSRWRNFSNLLREKGIGYNSITGQVIASDDVWKKLHKVNKMARKFRKEGCKEYDKLCVIYGGTITIGGLSHASTKSPSNDGDEETNKEECDNSDEEGEDTNKKKKLKQANYEGINHPKAREQCHQKANGQVLITRGENSRKKLKLKEKKMSSGTSFTSVGNGGDGLGAQFSQDEESVLSCLNALNELEGIDGRSYTKATKFIHDDALWRVMFLAMPRERKKDWVLNI